MKLICGMTAHNEDWVIGLTARAASLWADEVIVLNHNSDDHTQKVLEDANTSVGNIITLQEPAPEFTPLQFYRRLVKEAINRDATHLAILDADEMLSADVACLMREAVRNLAVGETLDVPWIPVGSVAPLMRYASDMRTGFVFPLFGDLSYPALPEAAYNIHYSRLPLSVTHHVSLNTDGGLLHLAYVDNRRLQAKELRWKMMEMLRWPGRRSVAWLNDYYDVALNMGELSECPNSWWTYQQLETHLHIGNESSIEKEVKRTWDPVRFAGLNTFGIV